MLLQVSALTRRVATDLDIGRADDGQSGVLRGRYDRVISYEKIGHASGRLKGGLVLVGAAGSDQRGSMAW